MNKQRLYITINSFLLCLTAFAQHPGSKGGNPLYWGVVGAIGLSICYLLYLLVGFILRLIKKFISREETLHGDSTYVEEQNITDSKEEVKPSLEDITNSELDADNAVEKNQKSVGVEEKRCVHCGKLIPKESTYCSYCGALQRKDTPKTKGHVESTKGISLNSLVKRFIRFLFMMVLCGLIGLIPAIICGSHGEHDLIPLCIIAPIASYIIYSLIVFAYNLEKKSKIIVAIVFVIIVLSLWGISIYDSVERDEKARLEYESKKKAEAYKINRTFLNCSLGESKSSIIKTLTNSKIPYLDKDETIILNDLSYGKYILDTLKFCFYKNKMNEVIMDFKTEEYENPDQPWTYNNLANVLNKKYNEDAQEEWDNNTGTRFKNIRCYRDYHTKVKLWHAGWNMGEYGVKLAYYDVDSGYNEKQENLF